MLVIQIFKKLNIRTQFMDLGKFCLYYISLCLAKWPPVDQGHNYGNNITIFYLKGFQNLMYAEAPGALDKYRFQGLTPETLIWLRGAKTPYRNNLPGDSEAIVLTPNPEIVLTEPNTN